MEKRYVVEKPNVTVVPYVQAFYNWLEVARFDTRTAAVQLAGLLFVDPSVTAIQIREVS